MFYIDTRLIRATRDLAAMHLRPVVVVLIAFIGMTVVTFIDARQNVRDEQSQILGRNLNQTQFAIQNRLSNYENILRAGTGLFNASGEVTRDEWRIFVSTFDIQNRYPGVQGIGYVSVIQPTDLQAHIERVRASGQPSYTPHPAGERDLYTSIDYIEPMSERNMRAIGYDMYSEPVRKKAMDTARDTGATSLTGIVRLVQESDSNPQPGFLMYVPLYSKDSQKQSITDRQQHLIGYIYAPYRVHDLLRQLPTANDTRFAFQVFAANTATGTPIFESSSYQGIAKIRGATLSTKTFNIHNQTWTIRGVIDPAIVPQSVRDRPVNVIFGGLLLSFFVSGFIYLLLLNRSRMITQRKDRELQEAKDELLALASHQLRTPATGVKQYIGMLREGFAGNLTPIQKKYVDKAYESNERQLNTINEMLVVARADAGTIALSIESFDISRLLHEITEEHEDTVREHQQTLVVQVPKRKHMVRADRRYIRMAIENILSNACKYTPDGGIITVTLKRTKTHTIIRVEDTGVGVSKTDYHLLFQKFSRIPNELTNKVTGSGIGLYLAQKIMGAHNGSITFKPGAKEGSVCTLRFPTKP